jgi:hypothetical protein
MRPMTGFSGYERSDCLIPSGRIGATTEREEAIGVDPLLTILGSRKPVATHGNGFRLFRSFRGQPICR